MDLFDFTIRKYITRDDYNNKLKLAEEIQIHMHDFISKFPMHWDYIKSKYQSCDMYAKHIFCTIDYKWVAMDLVITSLDKFQIIMHIPSVTIYQVCKFSNIEPTAIFLKIHVPFPLSSVIIHYPHASRGRFEEIILLTRQDIELVYNVIYSLPSLLNIPKELVEIIVSILLDIKIKYCGCLVTAKKRDECVDRIESYYRNYLEQNFKYYKGDTLSLNTHTSSEVICVLNI